MSTNEIRAVADFDVTVTGDMRFRTGYVLHGGEGDVSSVVIDSDSLWLEACRVVSMAWELRQLERFGRHLLEHGSHPRDVRAYLERAGRDVVAQVVDGTIDTIDTFAGSIGPDGGGAASDGDGTR